jgi:hypothetical protein
MEISTTITSGWSCSAKQEIGVIHQKAGVPGYHKDATGNNDAEYFCDAVKKKVIV